MFSSKKDLQGLILTLPVVLILFMGLYFAGVRIFLENNLLQKIETFFSRLNYYLFITAVLDLFVLLILSGNKILWQKILKRKIN